MTGLVNSDPSPKIAAAGAKINLRFLQLHSLRWHKSAKSAPRSLP